MSEDFLIHSDPAPGVRLLQLNRPDRRNALATPLLAALAAALEAADAAADIHCCVITGGPKVFAAGADIDELAAKDAAGGLTDPRIAAWAAIRSVRKPIVGAVNGWCLGAGNELLMCCDLVVAATDARFGQPETSLGIIPGAGGTATLPRLIGRARAMRMVLLGEPIDAAEARAAGLVNEVVPASEVLAAALAFAVKISGRAPLALLQAKMSVKAALELPHATHHTLERQAFALVLGSSDKEEGIAAFKEKRSPRWAGR
jgi:enoyl-CoA hydratase